MNKSRTSSAARIYYDVEYRRNRMFNTYLDCDLPPALKPARVNGYRSWCMRHESVTRWSNINWMVRFYIISLRCAHARSAGLNVQP
jgi:hypothetical protein